MDHGLVGGARGFLQTGDGTRDALQHFFLFLADEVHVLQCAQVERAHLVGEGLEGGLLVLFVSGFERVGVVQHAGGEGVQIREELGLCVGEGLHDDLRHCAKVLHCRGLVLLLARGAVVQAGQQHFVAVGVDVVEGLLLMLGQGVEREVEKNRKDQPEQGRVEGGTQSAGDVVDGADDLADVLDIAEAHPTDRVGKSYHRPDEPQERDRPQEGAQQNVAAHDPGAVDGGLAAHHAADFGHILADFEKLEGLADTVDHEAVPEFDGEAVDVVDESAHVLGVDGGTQVLWQHVKEHGAPLQLELEHLQVTDSRRPEEEEGVGEADREVLVEEVGQCFPSGEFCGGLVGGRLEKIDERKPSNRKPKANPETQDRIGICRVLLLPNIAGGPPSRC